MKKKHNAECVVIILSTLTLINAGHPVLAVALIESWLLTPYG